MQALTPEKGTAASIHVCLHQLLKKYITAGKQPLQQDNVQTTPIVTWCLSPSHPQLPAPSWLFQFLIQPLLQMQLLPQPVSAKQSPFQAPMPRHEWEKRREDERRWWRRKMTERGSSRKMPGPSHNTDQSLDTSSAQSSIFSQVLHIKLW